MTDNQQHRSLLFGIAYRMTGMAMDAEDIVQEAYLRYEKLETPPDSPVGYLRKITTNLCLDYLKSARVKREEYVGEWLPEPIITESSTPDETVARAEYISMAFLVVLETLSPLERAVFLLREVFDYGYDEIADMLEKSEAACRQHFSRAKKHIHNHRTRLPISSDQHTSLVTQFVSALESGNITTLTNVLAEDAILYSDGGGKVVAALHPIYGRDKVLRFLLGLQRISEKQNIAYEVQLVRLNGGTGLITRETHTGQVIFAATFDVQQDIINAIRIIRNPDKLKQLNTR